MTEADDRLRAIFAADAPPARDPAFSTAVAEAVARRRLLGEMAFLGGAAAAGAAALSIFWPSLEPLVVETSRGLFPVAAALAVAVCLLGMLGAKPRSAFGLDS